MVRLSLQMLVTGQAGVKDISGPVGIVSVITDVGQSSSSASAAVRNIAYLAAMIAVNLAVMNLLPCRRWTGENLLPGHQRPVHAGDPQAHPAEV